MKQLVLIYFFILQLTEDYNKGSTPQSKQLGVRFDINSSESYSADDQVTKSLGSDSVSSENYFSPSESPKLFKRKLTPYAKKHLSENESVISIQSKTSSPKHRPSYKGKNNLDSVIWFMKSI